MSNRFSHLLAVPVREGQKWNRGFTIVDDMEQHNGSTTANSKLWDSVETNVTIAASLTEINGVQTYTTGGADGDGVQLASNGEPFALAAGRRTILQARIKTDDADLTQLFFGLSTGAGTLVSDALADDHLGFLIDTADGNLDTTTSKNATATANAAVTTISDDTWVELSIWVYGTDKVKFFVDGSLVATHTTNLPDDENLSLILEMQAPTAAARVFSADFVFAVQDR